MTSTWDSLNAEADKVVLTTTQQAAVICSLLKNAISALADGFAEAEIKGNDSARAQS